MINEEDDCNDTICWNDEPSSMIYVTSTYNLVHNNAKNEVDSTWTNIWKLKVLNKMRVFLWSTYHQRIMSNELRKKKGFTNQDNCHKCHDIVEDADHILRRCPNAYAIWKRVDLVKHVRIRWNKPFLNWLGENVKGSGNGNSS